ncbi:MAG TPA: hypothetical protein VHM26_18340 [Chitinophagaceae bacterium]|jgi:hypothetical protein|nr:hypothetical protein [Chitinophagaceae bacterium]
MKQKLFLLFFCCLSTALLFAQKQTFDIATYTAPKGWNKQAKESAIQLAKEDASGAFCLITLYKSLPTNNEAKKNFDVSWDALVKTQLDTKTDPEMQPQASDDGWEVQSGHATFEKDGVKGIALLVSSTGHDKLVNVLIMTNTDAFEKDVTAFLQSIDLKKPTGTSSTKEKAVNVTVSTTTTKATATPAVKSKFKFTTTNFPDGWTATEQPDWVELSKGNIKVLIHYPNEKADAYNSVLVDGLKKAWDILVASRYSNASNLQFRPVQSWESIEYADGFMKEKGSGRNVYVVLFKKNFSKGNGRYMEFIAPDKESFEKEFGAWHEESYGWEKMSDMQFRNRFAVAAGDITGAWSTTSHSSLSYYYVNTGGYAGATATATAHDFTFMSNGTYESDFAGASGVVGNQQFSRQQFKGKATVTNWKMTLTNRFKGQTENFDCHFEAVKNGRILVLIDELQTVLSLVKKMK